MKNIPLLIIFLGACSIAQVGINTTQPEGALDIVTTNNLGLILPRVANIESVTDGNGGSPVNGTTVYDLSRNATCFYVNDKWSCLEIGTNGNPQIVAGIPPIPFSECTYVKASNTDSGDTFGGALAISGDGNTLAVAAINEQSNASGINGNEANNSAATSGAVYVFFKTGGTWMQQAYIKASNTDAFDFFGSISISDNGNTLAVGASGEDSNAIGINGDQTTNSSSDSGAVYVFERSGSTWSQQAYIKASNANSNDGFGGSISISDDGNTLAVGASGEDSNAIGINGDQTNNSISRAGAVYIFNRSGSTWSQEAYIKASNPDIEDFFSVVALSGNGLTLVVAAGGEDSNATGINGDQTNNSASFAGAVYVFIKSGGVWSQQAYIKASNAENGDRFGTVSLSDNGNTLAVGASFEDSNATGINGSQGNNGSGLTSGAVYIFERSGTIWSQVAYVKASNTGNNDLFGRSLCISGDGNKLVVGALQEDSNATGVNGDETNNLADQSGAVYIFENNAGVWSQQTYLKASNAEANDSFSSAIVLSDDGSTVVVSANLEDSAATGINGDQSNNSAAFSGAVYICEE